MFVRHATIDGTAEYRERFAGRLHPDHFRLYNGLWFSSIGMGIYVNNVDPETQRSCTEALIHAMGIGCNHVDAAISHRSQQSEQIVGQALGGAFARGIVNRNEVIVSARGGSVYFEGEYPTDTAAFVRRNLIDARVAAADEFAQGWHHCLSPRYLRMQFRRSLTNLGLGALDIYYLHNPEVQRFERGPEVFRQRLLAAFAELEAQIEAERLAYYGLATEDGFRVPPGDPAYLSLELIVELARSAGGDNHHLRYMSAPLNLAAREILEFRNQKVRGREMTLLDAARELGIVVIGTETLWKGDLAWSLPAGVRTLFSQTESNAQAAIQFARSVPGLASALVGMTTYQHVKENLTVARLPLASPEQLTELL